MKKKCTKLEKEIKNKEVQRNFILGDSWIYYKVYTGYKTSDKVLINIIRPIANKLIEKQIIDKWFFIRYADPKSHIRIRFHFTKKENIFLIINSFHPYFKDFIEKKLIWKIQTDTYKREIERYGIKSISLSEDLFYYESKMVVDFLNVISGKENENIRWLFSLKSIDSLLNSLKYSDNAKSELLFVLSSSFKKEFNSSKHLIKQLSSKYREHQKKIEEFMMKSENNHDFSNIFLLLKEKEENIEKTVDQLFEISSDIELEMGFNNLISSHIHMLMNRLFKSRNRLHEMVCYDFLFRYYKSKVARKISK